MIWLLLFAVVVLTTVLAYAIWQLWGFFWLALVFAVLVSVVSFPGCSGKSPVLPTVQPRPDGVLSYKLGPPGECRCDHIRCCRR